MKMVKGTKEATEWRPGFEEHLSLDGCSAGFGGGGACRADFFAEESDVVMSGHNELIH
jgi:hypothetical protein